MILMNSDANESLMGPIRLRLDRFKILPDLWWFPGGNVNHELIEKVHSICQFVSRFNTQIPRFTPHPIPGGLIRVEWMSLGGRIFLDVTNDSVLLCRRLLDEGVEIGDNLEILEEVLSPEKSGTITPQSWLQYSVGKDGKERRRAHAGVIFWLESHIETDQFDIISKDLKNNPPELLDPSIVLTILSDCANLPIDGFDEWKNLAKNTEAWEHVPEAWQ